MNMPMNTLSLHAATQLAPALSPALSPRLQRAVRLLQMSSLDFSQAVRQQLDTNPFLEPVEAWEPGSPAGDTAGAEWDLDAQGAPATDGSEGAGGIDRTDDPVWEASSADPLARGRIERGEAGGFDTLAAPLSLAEHLASQLRLLPLPARDLALALTLAHALDDDGYLRLPLREATAPLGLAPPAGDAELAIALRRVQALEPAGVGARDVAECLLLQLSQAPLPSALRELAVTIVRHHLPALAGRDLAGLARRVRAPRPEVEHAVHAIRRLDPHPGWRHGVQTVHYVTPDVVVRRVRGQWTAALNPVVVPRVRVNQRYAELYARHRDACPGELAAHLQEARWMVRNVEQRFSTILAVSRAILQRQHRFLTLGAMAMRPLALREIAQAVGAHESTVSRVTNNKYMATPCGVFELKYFFSRGLATASGGECSPTAVRSLIQDLIAAEPREAPLSDVALAAELARQGLRVARRTVTKYRQQLRIEPAERRYSSIR